MKIDELTIKHNALQCIKEALGPTAYDLLDHSEEDNMSQLRIMALGEIQGILNLTNALLEVLKM